MRPGIVRSGMGRYSVFSAVRGPFERNGCPAPLPKCLRKGGSVRQDLDESADTP